MDKTSLENTTSARRNLLKEALDEIRLSTNAMARQSGVSQQVLSRVVNGERNGENISTSTLKKLIAAFPGAAWDKLLYPYIAEEPKIDYNGLYRYRGFSERLDSVCHLRVNGNVVIATDLEQQQGTSITNMCESLATNVCVDFKINPSKLIWFEHYDDFSKKCSREKTSEDIKRQYATQILKGDLLERVYFSIEVNDREQPHACTYPNVSYYLGNPRWAPQDIDKVWSVLLIGKEQK